MNEPPNKLKYAAADSIRDLAAVGPPRDAARALLTCVRLPTGPLQDDVAIVVAD